MHTRPNSDYEVIRLKELLFDDEQRAIGEIRSLVDLHHTRVGNDERLTKTVADVLADALRQADVKQHRELASAISPVVVSGIKREITNSRDEMVDALYPIMGRLVSAYVKSAMRDVMESTNARLESGLTGRYFRLRMKSLLTGRPYRELVLAEGGRLRILELLLIKRSNGTLVDRWRSLAEEGAVAADDSSSELLGGMLSAVNDFSREALAGSSDELRMMETGEARIYLRSSPAHLLAVKCSGRTTRRLEKAIDGALIQIIEDHSELLGNADDAASKTALRAILPEVAERLTGSLEAEKRPPVLAFALVSMLGLALAGLYGWHLWHGFQIDRLKQRVAAVITSERAFEGYPIETVIADDLGSVKVSGLAPSEQDGQILEDRIATAIGPARLDAKLAFVPTISRLRRNSSDLIVLSDRLKEIEAGLGVLANRDEIATRFHSVEQRLDTTADRQSVEATAGEVARLQTVLTDVREQLGGLASRTATEGLSADVAGLAAKIGGLDQLSRQIDELGARLLDPQRDLMLLLARRAVFFGSGTVLRDGSGTKAFIAEVVKLAELSGAGLRVVGYTDATGTPESNRDLATARANVVAGLLAAAGLPRARLVIVSRSNTVRIASDQPGGAPSERRVELEAAFEGEVQLGNGNGP